MLSKFLTPGRRRADGPLLLVQGSIFVEFASQDAVAKLLALDPKPTYEGAELEMMSK